MNYVSLLRVNVTSKRLPLPQFDEDFTGRCGSAFAEYLAEKKSLPFSKSEAEQISAFFDGLTCTNSAELIKHLDYYQQVFSKIFDSFNVEAEKQNGMYVKLGLLLGAMIGVLFL